MRPIIAILAALLFVGCTVMHNQAHCEPDPRIRAARRYIGEHRSSLAETYPKMKILPGPGRLQEHLSQTLGTYFTVSIPIEYTCPKDLRCARQKVRRDLEVFLDSSGRPYKI